MSIQVITSSQLITTSFVKLGTKVIRTSGYDKAVLYLEYDPAENAAVLQIYFKTGPNAALLSQTTRKESTDGASTVFKEIFSYTENLGNANDDYIQIPLQLADDVLEVWVTETSTAKGTINIAEISLFNTGKQ